MINRVMVVRWPPVPGNAGYRRLYPAKLPPALPEPSGHKTTVLFLFLPPAAVSRNLRLYCALFRAGAGLRGIGS